MCAALGDLLTAFRIAADVILSEVNCVEWPAIPLLAATLAECVANLDYFVNTSSSPDRGLIKHARIANWPWI